jgi:hypothetical protein
MLPNPKEGIGHDQHHELGGVCQETVARKGLKKKISLRQRCRTLNNLGCSHILLFISIHIDDAIDR